MPAADENVTLLSGMRLLLSSAEAPATAPLRLGYVVVQENATLVLATHGAPVEIHLLGITIRGELQGGTEACPVSASLVLELAGARLPLSMRGSPPPAYRKGIYVTDNGVAQLHGASVGTRGWTRLASPHDAGATSLLVRAGAEAWSTGARIRQTRTRSRGRRIWSLAIFDAARGAQRPFCETWYTTVGCVVTL